MGTIDKIVFWENHFSASEWNLATVGVVQIVILRQGFKFSGSVGQA